MVTSEQVKAIVMTLPDFDNLPPVAGKPQGCAWGVFDKDGQRDKYGTLNLLTPEVVRAASGEIQRGVSVSLKCVSSLLS